MIEKKGEQNVLNGIRNYTVLARSNARLRSRYYHNQNCVYCHCRTWHDCSFRNVTFFSSRPLFLSRPLPSTSNGTASILNHPFFRGLGPLVRKRPYIVYIKCYIITHFTIRATTRKETTLLRAAGAKFSDILRHLPPRFWRVNEKVPLFFFRHRISIYRKSWFLS